MTFQCRLLRGRYLLRTRLVDDAVLNDSAPQSPDKLFATVCAVAKVLPDTSRDAAERVKATALRVAMSDGTGGIDEACRASLEVGTVVHDDSLHHLLAHRALNLLLIKQRLLELFGAFGAVAQMLSGSGVSVDC